MKTYFNIRLIAIIMGILMSAFNNSADAGPYEKGITAGVSLGLYNDNSDHHVGLIVRPNIGYKFNRHWEAGGFFRYENLGWGSHAYSAALYGEYNFYPFTLNGLSLFVDFQAAKIWYPLDYDNPNTEHHMEFGFVPGLKYHIPRSKADLRLRYLFLGYNNCSHLAPHGIGHGDWSLDASLRRLELGVSVTF